MEKRPFLYLTQADVLDKINIDSRLISAFVNVMKKMDAYFLANGYYELKDYRKFFEDFLIDKEFSIQCNNEPSMNGVGGFYDRLKNVIVIDERWLNTKNLESTICHEFIHFLVMHDLDVKKHGLELVNGGFFNEALTEMLNQQIYPNSRAYEPQVKMVTFSNLISGQVNDYRGFLQGFWSGPGSSWKNYLEAANDYFKNYYQKGYRLEDAIIDENYINAQRYAIDAFVGCGELTNFDQYLEILENLDKRPVEDQEYIDKVLNKKEIQLINSVYRVNAPINSLLVAYLKEQFEKLKMIRRIMMVYNGKPFHEFTINGRRIAIDRDGKLYGDYFSRRDNSFSYSFNPSENKVTIDSNGEKKVLFLDKLDYLDYASVYNGIIAELRKYFINKPEKDIEMISRFKNNARNLVRVEKFILPAIKTKYSKTVYVATYTDGIEVLNGFPPLDYKDSYHCADYVGLTSQTLKNALIVSENDRIMNNGILYSIHELPFVRAEVIRKIARVLLDTMDDTEKDRIFNQYKMSDMYLDDDTLMDALEWYVKANYGSLDKEELHRFILEVLNENEKVLVTTVNGRVEVFYTFSEGISFTCDRQVLLDKGQDALFNGYFKCFDTDKLKEDRKIGFVPFDEYGRLSLTKLEDFSVTPYLFK